VESTAASTSSDRNNLAARPSFSRGKQKKGVPLLRRMKMAPPCVAMVASPQDGQRRSDPLAFVRNPHHWQKKLRN